MPPDLSPNPRSLLDPDAPSLPDVFAPTTIMTAIEEAAYFAGRLGTAAAITGPAGIGKSTALRKLLVDRPNAVFGEGRKFRNLKALFTFVTSAFHLPVHDARSNENLRHIIDNYMPALARRGYMLLVDEMQDLELHTLREIVGYAEEHRLPVLLVGNERSLRKRPRMDTYTFDQILSRIGKTIRLTTPTADDFAMWARLQGVTDPDAVEAIAHYGLRSSFRAVRNLLKVALDIAGSADAVNRAVLAVSIQWLMSDESSVRLLSPLKKTA